MSELFDKSIRTLELPRVLQLLSEQAVSPEAKELALAVRPETDYEDVLRLLDQFADKIPAELLTALKSDATPEVPDEYR